ncbi:MAG: hypothetical protein ACR2JE_09775 [Acidobacteriaceae bacterium]
MFEQQEQIPDEYLKAIGRVTVEWNQLESILDLCLIRLLGKDLTDPRSHIVFTHMAYPQKMNALKALIGQVEIPAGSSLGRYSDEVQPLLKAASEERNKIMHSKWGMEKGQVYRSTLQAKGALKVSHVYVPVDDVIAACDHIIAGGEALFSAVVGQLLDDSSSPQHGQ